MQVTAEPIYLQIHRALRQEVLEQHQPGEQLPPEGKLAERFNVNRHTLRRAVDELVNEGLLERRRGIGLFVLEPTFEYPLHAQTRLTTNLAEAGLQGKRNFVRKYVAPASERIASRLALDPGTPVICLHYLITANGRSFSLARHFFEQSIFQKIFDEFSGEGSLHAFIQDAYGIKLKRVLSTISASLPSFEDASTLRVPRTLPILTVRSLNLSLETDTPVEYVESVFRSDRIELSVRF